MNWLKIKIVEFLCLPIIGKLIAWVFNDRIPFHGTWITTKSKVVSNRIKAMLCWRLYESAEVRFVKKYITGQYDVIELGSSIGAVSVQLGKRMEGKKMILVEANPGLKEVLEQNLKNNKIENYSLLNLAYGSREEKVWFQSGKENILGKSVTSEQGEGVWVDSVSLKSLISRHDLSDYALVCDIEGAEIELLLHEAEALQGCKLLIIETHETQYGGQTYTPQHMKTMFLEKGFKLIEEYGVNLVMSRA